MPDETEADNREFTAMNDELGLSERLKIAKHFAASFELDHDEIILVDTALDQLRCNEIMRDDAEALYWEKRFKKTRNATLNILVGFTALNALIVAVLYGGMYWLM